MTETENKGIEIPEGETVQLDGPTNLEGPLQIQGEGKINVKATKDFSSAEPPELSEKEQLKLRQQELLKAKQQKKFEEAQIREYKKSMQDTVEIKRLQVESLHLDIQYIQFKQQLKDLEPIIKKMEEEEAAEQAKAAEPAGPKIEVVKQGKPRDK